MASVDTDSDSETLRIIEDPSRGFLDSLSPQVFPCYPYRDRAQFQNDFHHALRTTNSTIEWFLVSAVNNQIFTTEFLNAEEPPFSRWCAYDRTAKLLLINMVKTEAHEMAANHFDQVFHEALFSIGMERSLQMPGSATRFAKIGAKEPDRSWRPISLPRGRLEKWPTVVLEVAYSGTGSKLQADLRYWLTGVRRGAEEEVKTILTIWIAEDEPCVVIERWENRDGDGRCQQRVVIKRTCSGQMSITGGPLVLEFERIFLRAPTIPRERNIEIDDEKLEFVARRVWSMQGF
ncbi:hypothetical protein BDV18DRAFT_96084 [Aspergillus unguis]